MRPSRSKPRKATCANMLPQSAMQCGDPNTGERLEQRHDGERLLPPWSLRDKCVWNIRTQLLARGRRGTGDSSAFRMYPVQLRQEILDSMLKLKPDGREIIDAVELLVQSGIIRFDLSVLDECDTRDVFRVIDLLTVNGVCLEELHVGGQWLFDQDANTKVNKLLQNVPNVRKLVLQEVTREGQQLETALKFCPKLSHLVIRQPSIDDDHLTTVATTMCRDGFLASALSLVSLHVPSTVTGQGLLSLLRAFPNLQYLNCTHLDDLLNVLEAKSGDEREWWTERMAGLKAVNSSLPLGQGGVISLVFWCPNLISVSLEVQVFTKLSSLTKLSKLRSLELRNSATLPASYIEGVLPLLEAVGAKLNHLCLEHFDVVDLMKTTLYCAELESLSLRWFTLLGSSGSNRIKGHKPFEHLRSLILRPRTNRYINQEACELLLSHCKELAHLELYCCHGLVDASVLNLVKTNPLASMKNLVLRHGHGLSAKGIRALISKANKLTFWDFGVVNPSKPN